MPRGELLILDRIAFPTLQIPNNGTTVPSTALKTGDNLPDVAKEQREAEEIVEQLFEGT
jgi:hypothetical protein